MKSIYILLTSIFLLSNCIAQQSEGSKIIYEATTRGSSIELTIIQSKIKLIENNHTTRKQLTPKQHKKLRELIKEVDLQSIHSLIAPSTKSHFDGAMSASLSIQYQGVNYESSRFDHGNPPDELKELIDYIFDLIYADFN